MIRYTLTVPVRDSAGELRPIIHDTVRDDLVRLTGGVTVTSGVGAWRNDQGVPITEHVRVYTADHDGRTASIRTAIIYLAQWVKETMAQDAVYITETPITATLI